MSRSRGSKVVLLGPQRRRPRVTEAVADLGVNGPLAAVTAGWEEREHEQGALARDLGGRTRNLRLYPRAEQISASDDTARALMNERHDRLGELQRLYRLRLAPQLRVCRTLLAATDPADPDALHGPEIESALAGIRALDRHYLDRTDTLEAEMAERLRAQGGPTLERHRSEVAELLDQTEAVLVAGGNVGTLLGLLRLFEMDRLLGGKPVVAWSGGAMAVADRVVLFHDAPPQAPGDAELLGRGLGLASGVVPLPHARHRLRLDDAARVALLARRLAPATSVALDYGGRIDPDPGTTTGAGWRPDGGASILHADGRVEPSPPTLPATPEARDPSAARPDTDRADAPILGRTRRPPVIAEVEPADVVGRLQIAAAQGPRAVDRFLASIPIPAIGPGWAVFVYRGRADQVRLRHWVSGLPSTLPFTRLAGTGLWVLEMELQLRARIEYKLEIVAGDREELITDPLNPALAHDPFGANSVVQGPGYRRPAWTHEQPTARRGTVVEASVASEAFGHERSYSLYLPARYRDTRRYPLLVVHDGLDYLRYASLATVLDNLIHRLEIPPLVAVLTQSGERTAEYGADERHARFLVDELIPAVENSISIVDDTGQRGLLGASLGAVAGLHAAWRRPGAFGRLLLQSGSFAFTDIGPHDLGPVFDPVVEFVNRFRARPGRPADRVFLSAGIYESLIYFNRSLLPVLQGTGAEVRLVESQDGHNWVHWRDQLRDGLTWLFPGPLWMVYD